jgi:hypothetical protein
MGNEEVLLKLVSGKKIILATHWDADGVSSGAMVYHLIKNQAKQIKFISKGEIFLITPKDIEHLGDYDYVICIDIKPSLRLEHEKVIYFDHHPNKSISENFKMTIHDHSYQSTSILLYEKLLDYKKHPLYIFLALLGYFGDGGDLKNIPSEEKIIAHELIPEYLRILRAYGREYTVLQSLVSSLNVGKRMDWSGEVCLELLMSIEHPEMFCIVPQYEKILRYKNILKGLYNKPVGIQTSGTIDYVLIDCEQNIQGVLCARYMKQNPILVINKRKGWYVGSMRIPDNHFLDAGIILSHISENIPTFDGGGHEKAGGFRFKEEDIMNVLSYLTSIDNKKMEEIMNTCNKKDNSEKEICVYD